MDACEIALMIYTASSVVYDLLMIMDLTNSYGECRAERLWECGDHHTHRQAGGVSLARSGHEEKDAVPCSYQRTG